MYDTFQARGKAIRNGGSRGSWEHDDVGRHLGDGHHRVVQLPFERAERSGTWPMNLVTSFHLIFSSMSETREHTIVTAQPREAGQ